MKEHTIILILAVAFSINSNAQEEKKFYKGFFGDGRGLQIGYKNFENTKFYLGYVKSQEGILNSGFGAYFSYDEQNRLEIIPEANFNLGYIVMGELSLTTKSFNPTLGLNLANYVMIKAGYNFSFSANDFRGITFGVFVDIGREKHYLHLPPMKFMP